MNPAMKVAGRKRIRIAAAVPLFLLLAALCAFAPECLRGQAKGPARGKWVTLFDGKTMANWNPTGNANWRLMGGAVVADKGMGYLVSKNAYKDFEVRAEFWTSDDANSGVFIRCADPQKVGADNCYEVNIFDTRPDPTYGTGAITNIAKPSVFLKAGGKWNTYDITAQGPHLVVVLNGTKTVDTMNSKLPSGPIALQAFAGTVKFRKVQIRSL